MYGLAEMAGESSRLEIASSSAIRPAACIHAHESRQLTRRHEATSTCSTATKPQVAAMVTSQSEPRLTWVVHQAEIVAISTRNDGAAVATHALACALQVTQQQHMFTRICETQLSNECSLVGSRRPT